MAILKGLKALKKKVSPKSQLINFDWEEIKRDVKGEKPDNSLRTIQARIFVPGLAAGQTTVEHDAFGDVQDITRGIRLEKMRFDGWIQNAARSIVQPIIGVNIVAQGYQVPVDDDIAARSLFTGDAVKMTDIRSIFLTKEHPEVELCIDLPVGSSIGFNNCWSVLPAAALNDSLYMAITLYYRNL